MSTFHFKETWHCTRRIREYTWVMRLRPLWCILSLLYVLTIESMKSSAYCCQPALLELAIRRLRECAVSVKLWKIAFIHWLLFSVTACQSHWMNTYKDKKSFRDQKEGECGSPNTLHSIIWPAEKWKVTVCQHAKEHWIQNFSNAFVGLIFEDVCLLLLLLLLMESWNIASIKQISRLHSPQFLWDQSRVNL